MMFQVQQGFLKGAQTGRSDEHKRAEAVVKPPPQVIEMLEMVGSTLGYYSSSAPVKISSDALITALSPESIASIFPKYFGNSAPR